MSTASYNCPCCGGPLTFSGKSGKLECVSCGNSFEPEALEMLKMKDKKEIRCGHCNKLLGKGTAHDLEIKCPRCGTLNHLRDRIPGSEPSDGQNGAFYAGSEEKISH